MPTTRPGIGTAWRRLHARPINSERSTVPVSDDEEDLFGGRTAAAPAGRQPGRSAPAASHSPAPAPARTAAAQPAQRSGAAAAKPSASLFSSSDDEDMFHAAAKASEAAAKTAAAVRKPASGPTAATPIASTAAPGAAKPPPKGLFDSDSDDDIFSLVAPGRAKTPPRAQDVGRRADPLADSPPPVRSSGVATATARPPLLSTGVENVRAMGPTAPGSSAPTVSAATVAAPTIPAAAAKPPEKPAAQEAKPPVSSLFLSSSEEDLFASSASTGRAPAAKSKAAASVPAPAVEPTPSPAPTAAQAPAPLSAPEPVPAPAPALAPAVPAAAPSADVTAMPATAASKAALTAAAPAAKAKKAVSASLFDSDSDEDDLFHPAAASRTAASAKAAPASTNVTKPASRAPVDEKAQETPNSSVKTKLVDEHGPVKGSAISPDAVSPPVEPTADPSEDRAPSPAAADAPDSPGVVRRSGGGPSGARPVSAGLSALAASIEHQLGSSARRRSTGPAGGVALFGAAGPTARLSPSPPVSPTTHPPADSAREVGSPPESPSQSPVRSPAAAAAGLPPPEVVRRRPEPKRHTRPASVPTGRPEVSSPPPTHTAADLGPADPLDTLPSLTKERPRGPVKRRPSRKKPGSNRLSLPPESSQFQSVTSPAPADEPPEDRPVPSAAAAAVRRPPAGGQRLPGLINAELRGRLARRTGSDAADGTDGSGGPPLSPETPGPSTSGTAPVQDTAPDRGSADVRTALGGIPEDPSAARSQTAISPAVVADSVRTGSTVLETPVASDRTTLPTAVHPVVPETPAAPSPTDLARPSVPARPAAAPPPAGQTPAPTPGKASASPAARAAASLFDSDSDEDLFHMPAPRPAQRVTDASAASGAPRVAGEPQKTVVKSAVIPPSSAKPESVAVGGSQEVTGSEQDLSRNGERSTETASKTASIAAPSKSDFSPSPKPVLKPKPSSSHPVPQPSVISDPSAREMPPEEDSTLPPAPPPPAGGLFDDSDEEDLFHSVPAPQSATGASGASVSALGTPAGAQMRHDEGRREGGVKTTAKEELAGTQADTRGSEADRPRSAEENVTVRDEATALTHADDNHSVPKTGSTSGVQPPSPAPVTAAAEPGPVKSAAAPGPVKPGHGIFDSDSDEDLFQTMQKSKPAVKEPVEAPKAPSAEQKSMPTETLSSATLSPASREQDAKRSSEDNVGRVADTHKAGDEGSASSEVQRSTEEKAEMPSDSVTQNNAAESPTPSQHSKTSRSVFESDSEEDLFQTVKSKPKSAHVPGAAPVSENMSPAPKVNPPLAVTNKSPLEVAVHEEKTPSPSGSPSDTDSPADIQPPQSSDSPERSAEVTVSGDQTGPSPGGGRRSPPGDVGSAQDEHSAANVAKGHDKTRTDGGGSSGVVSEAETEGALPASSQQESTSGDAVSGVPASEAHCAIKTAALDADEPVFSEVKLAADDKSPEAAVAPPTPDTKSASVAAPPSPQTSVVSESDPIPPAAAASTAAKSSRSIFDSDSDEEDLFQTMKPKSAVKTPATGQKSPSLRASAMSATVTHTETNDPTARMKDATSGVADNTDVNSSKPVNQKSPATATAIAGKDAVDTEPLTVAPGAASPPAPLGKTGGSLFDSDSDDDLFKSTKRSKPAPTKAVPVNNNAVTKPTSEAFSSVLGKSKNIQNLEKKPTKSPSDIGEIRPVTQPGKETPKSVVLPRTSRKETKPSRGLFSSDSDEDDLFSTAKNRPAVTPSPTTNKRSSPARQPQSAANAAAAAAVRTVEPPKVAGSPLSVSAVAPPPAAAPVSAPTPVRTSASAAARPAVPPPAEDSDDDDLFGSTRNAPRPASQREEGWERAAAAAAASRAQPPAKTSASSAVTGSGRAKPTAAVPKTARAPPADSLFSDDDDDADLFSYAKTVPAARAPVRAGARLFSDSEEDEAMPTQAARHADHPNRTGAVSAAAPASHGVSAEPAKPQLKPATFDPLSGLLGD
ncbi:mucin-19-like isoform X2 [Amphibalanus amphitrite]|uniref:mucin-19-like isoform X2 n=1 Tax=Amphibalanus amphitrite TaxID=1232801 RepID=UPI001C8FE762|nr:mucin-19-like isoform X2 [Amphibalanus amphitrite]